MNTLTIKILDRDNSGYKYRVGKIFVDGKSLIEIIKPIELPSAIAEQHESIAGGYDDMECGMLKERLYDDKKFYGNDKTSVLVCECGEEGCWPFLVKVSETDKTITWSDFEQPHRKWDYSRLKPFVFDKKQYLKELEQLL